MMMGIRRRAGMAVAVALLVALSSCSVQVSAVVTTLPPGKKPSLTKDRYVPLARTKFGGKRAYQAVCGRDCYVGCPDHCPNSCLAFCTYCLSFCLCDFFPGTSCGDPRFTGGDGNTFYFHGKKEQDFCIVSDANLHINAHFIGNHNPEIKRDFTWVQALGVTFPAAAGAENHRLYVGARRATEWDEEEDHIQVTFDGVPVDIDAVRSARWTSKALPGGGLTVTRTKDVNAVTVELDGVFAISAGAVPITDEDDRVHKYGKTGRDSLVHLDLGFQFTNLTDHVDGVLGQTYRRGYVTKLDIGAKMPIMGGAPKYLSAGGLFSTDCAVSKFQRRRDATAVVTTYAS